MHDYVAGTDRARQRHQVADFGDILPPCRPPRVHLALSTKFQNLQFPLILSYLVSIPTEVGISFLLKFNRYMFFLSAKMSLLFLRTIISKLRRKIYDTSIKDALRLSTIVFEYLKEGLIGEISTEITIMVELIHGRVREREGKWKHRKFTGRPHAMIATCMRHTEMVRVERECDTLGRRTCETHYASW